MVIYHLDTFNGRDGHFERVEVVETFSNISDHCQNFQLKRVRFMQVSVKRRREFKFLKSMAKGLNDDNTISC